MGEDSAEIAEFCPDDSSYFCVRSSRCSFAVPKAPRWLADQWEHAGISCTVSDGAHRIRIFGREHADVRAIRCRSDDAGEMRFAYSRQAGVIAFGHSDEGMTWWLEGEIGFGAADP